MGAVSIHPSFFESFFISVYLRSSVDSIPPPGAPRKPSNRGKHSKPAEDTKCGADLRIVLQQSCMREQIKPIVDDVFRVTYGQQWKILAACVGHIDRDRKELLEEKEGAERRARHLAPERERGR